MWTDNIVVHPWIGGKYFRPFRFKHKTLILGESNYTEVNKFSSRLVIECVENDCTTNPSEERDTSGFCKFATKIRRTVFGHNEQINPNDFWQDVAFYNFVQSRVGDKARIRPTPEMWQESAPAFFEVVSMLRPDRLLVLGKRNWNNLLRYVDHQAIDQFAANLKVGSEFVTAGYINHPSSAFSYSTWQPIAQRLLLA